MRQPHSSQSRQLSDSFISCTDKQRLLDIRLNKMETFIDKVEESIWQHKGMLGLVRSVYCRQARVKAVVTFS